MLLLLATMPLVWSDGVKLKLYLTGRDYSMKPGLRGKDGSRRKQDKLLRDKDKRLQQLRHWLEHCESSLPANLLAALQKNPQNASTSEVATPAEHLPGVCTEQIEPRGCTAV